MQEDDYGEYRHYLQEGMRIEVGIPLSGGDVFRDWAVVAESAGDELLAQISRDVLPANVRVDLGFILDVSIWINKEAYTCSGIVTEKRGGRVLRIRLFGRFTPRERRQFFRINLELKVSYAFTSDASRADLERDWAHRKEHEQMKFQGYDAYVIAAHHARYQPAVKLQWQELAGSEVNLGGGGILLSIPEPVGPEEWLALEISLPLTPRRLVHAVARVIHVRPVTQRGEERIRVGLQFVLLDERDRDLLFRHISVTQIALLRKASELRELPEPAGGPAKTQKSREMLRLALLTLLLLILAVILARCLIRHRQAGSPNEIGETYQRALKQYRHQQ
ncbi:PilZ-like domain-containing protein [Geomonas sp.]|uniref:PilZ-like domain-containing protein n=1 Tax=Geomonas sp. TaxID=2651584 RepID=UPI002B4A4F6B|nr:PilZ-like domain-containing protein [Geomonas sp.]HJV34246.1 PilZ-like domain-containing protein [Geomonas sp.]